MPQTEAVRNWRLLECEITRALAQQGLQIEKNSVGDPCVGGIDIAALARALSARVLVKATVVKVMTD